MATATKAKKKGKLALQPLGDRVVVDRDESEETTAGGIVLPDAAKDKPIRGTVVAVGTGRVLDDGSRSDFQVKVGDRVLFVWEAPASNDRRVEHQAHRGLRPSSRADRISSTVTLARRARARFMRAITSATFSRG